MVKVTGVVCAPGNFIATRSTDSIFLGGKLASKELEESGGFPVPSFNYQSHKEKLRGGMNKRQDYFSSSSSFIGKS